MVSGESRGSRGGNDIDRITVGFDVGPALHNQTGVGRYASELAAHLELQGIEVKRFAIALRGPSGHHTARWRVPARVVQAGGRWVEQPSIRPLVGRVDVVHATNFVLPPLKAIPGVVTVHDLSFFREDIYGGLRRLRDQVPWSVKRARRVIVPSNAIASETVERLGVSEDKLAVTYEGVAPVFYGASPLADHALRELGITRPFMLAAGTIQPRKNLHRLLAAWRAAASDLPGWTLVLAGPAGWGPGLPETPGVRPIGWIGDQTLPGLLAAAEVFCYPSLYEGFGLPPLEAMAAGTPSLVGRYPAAEEVVGDAAWVVDPLNVEAMADGLTLLATDRRLRQRLTMTGRVRAAGFTWERTAAATIEAYRSVL
ncbi:MAG: glycosyltransferase family 4 protein [Actinomycetota bacterium]|nr:glycosyltransferase family 4 protein [Actinomycetota bacterium]